MPVITVLTIATASRKMQTTTESVTYATQHLAVEGVASRHVNSNAEIEYKLNLTISTSTVTAPCTGR